jgi:hypothetical protein
MRRTWLRLALAAAVAALAGSIALVATHAAGAGTTLTGGSGMMGGTATGMMNGAPVTSIAAARQRANSAAAPVGLHTGEVIWFDNGLYVELKDARGASATEVIVNPTTGAVSTEPGPAMMWNTRYGMHRTAGTPITVSAAQAQQIATRWVGTNLPGRRVQAPDAYPGYYTLETTNSGGTINGMLSVNASTGQVWYHNWHGTFIAREDS